MFNSLKALPSAPYKILQHLALNDDIIWKLLKHNDYDALSKKNLDMGEKLDLIWKYGPQEKYSVFLTSLVEDSIPVSKTILKVYQYHIQPNQLYTSAVTYAFDILYGGQMSLVDYDGIPVARGDLIIHRILTVLNGVYVGGVGKLSFYDDISHYSNSRGVVGNQKTYLGCCLYLDAIMGDTGLGEPCET